MLKARLPDTFSPLLGGLPRRRTGRDGRAGWGWQRALEHVSIAAPTSRLLRGGVDWRPAPDRQRAAWAHDAATLREGGVLRHEEERERPHQRSERCVRKGAVFASITCAVTCWSPRAAMSAGVAATIPADTSTPM